MSTISKASLSTLRKRADELFDALARVKPTEVAELRLLIQVIHQREHSTGADFVGVRSPRRAIELVLAERGDFMTKQQILDRLADGGFVKDARTEKWVINDNFNVNVKKGYFITRGNAEGWALEIGLPGFAPDSKIEIETNTQE